MSNIAHCCEEFLRSLELPAVSPGVCPNCKNQIVFDLVENENARLQGPVIRELVEDTFMIMSPEYLEKEVTIHTKEYETGNEPDHAVVQRQVLSQYLREFPVFTDKRYRNSVLIIQTGGHLKALAKTAIFRT